MPAPAEPQSAPPSPPPPHLGFLQVVAAVLSAFIGIRKKSGFEADRAAIKPTHVIVAGIIGALIFIATLVTLVRFIIAK
jgi:hypothetical protein